MTIYILSLGPWVPGLSHTASPLPSPLSPLCVTVFHYTAAAAVGPLVDAVQGPTRRGVLEYLLTVHLYTTPTPVQWAPDPPVMGT